MKKRELAKTLRKLGINKDYYSLNGIDIPGKTILNFEKGQWFVYNINERGKKTDLVSFEEEEKACRYILKVLKDEKDLQDKIDSSS